MKFLLFCSNWKLLGWKFYGLMVFLCWINFWCKLNRLVKSWGWMRNLKVCGKFMKLIKLGCSKFERGWKIFLKCFLFMFVVRVV